VNNVFDISTGEPVKAKKTRPRRAVLQLTGMLSQREDQIDELMFAYVEKGTLEIKYGVATHNEFSSRSLLSYLEDHVRSPEEPED